MESVRTDLRTFEQGIPKTTGLGQCIKNEQIIYPLFREVPKYKKHVSGIFKPGTNIYM